MILLALLFANAAPPQHVVFPGGEGDEATTAAAKPRCDAAAEEIVVCGTADQEQFRLRKTAPRYVETPVRAATRLGQGELAVEAEQRELPGARAPAAMVRFRVPLGGKPK